MHRFRDPRTLSRLVSIAILEWLKWLMALATLCLFVWGGLAPDSSILLAGLMFGGLALACQALVFTAGRFTRCPLCMVPILGSSMCHLHKRAGRCFGSIRLKVSWDVLTKNRISCPYCNEPIELIHTPTRS